MWGKGPARHPVTSQVLLYPGFLCVIASDVSRCAHTLPTWLWRCTLSAAEGQLVKTEGSCPGFLSPAGLRALGEYSLHGIAPSTATPASISAPCFGAELLWDAGTFLWKQAVTPLFCLGTATGAKREPAPAPSSSPACAETLLVPCCLGHQASGTFQREHHCVVMLFDPVLGRIWESGPCEENGLSQQSMRAWRVCPREARGIWRQRGTGRLILDPQQSGPVNLPSLSPLYSPRYSVSAGGGPG